MNKALKIGIITVITLLSFTCTTQQAVGRYTLPDRDKVVVYVNNLIDRYNTLVEEYDKPRPDFAIIKPHFSLYHDAGNSFKVIVVQTAPNEANQISLIFLRIRADQPNVSMDYNDTFTSLFNVTEMFGFFTVDKDIPFTYNGTVIRQDLVLGIQASELMANPITSSTNAANTLYQNDQSEVPTVSQTRTVIQTLSQTEVTTIQSGPYGNIWDDFVTVSVIVGFAASIVYLYEKRPFGRLRKHSEHE